MACSASARSSSGSGAPSGGNPRGQRGAALDPGTYVFICNIVDKDTGTSHYYAGMRVGFTVE